MMFHGPEWFANLVKLNQTATVEENIWRLHPQPEGHFFADYLPQSFLKGIEAAREIGWRSSVEQGLSSLTPYVADYTRDYFLASYRSDFVNDLHLQPGSMVLDIGCGWGFASQRCLDSGALVVGTDNSIKRLDFCAARFEQQGYKDRFVAIELDANREIPFKDSSFDAVIVSGLVEWLPETTYGDPSSIQSAFMEKVYKLLRPGGRLYLAIENRYWGRYFLGARDLHSLQRLTSILPRRIARAYSLLLSGKDYRVYTYSLFAYINLLKRLGFQKLDVTYPDPDYVQPKTTYQLIRDLDLEPSFLRVIQDVVRQRPNWKMCLFGRSFMFVATKSGTRSKL